VVYSICVEERGACFIFISSVLLAIDHNANAFHYHVTALSASFIDVMSYTAVATWIS
jgi:hypothetical protein